MAKKKTTKARAKKSKLPIITCTPKRLPAHMESEAAKIAVKINPHNHPRIERLAGVMSGFVPTRARISVVTSRYWGPEGVRLTVGFLDGTPQDLRTRILEHMNAWSKTANVKFTESNTNPQVRIARVGGQAGGYWSYLGTEILQIEPNEPTMNLEGFTMATSEAEFTRVVRHETGHTLGFPHEHMREEFVNMIDEEKALSFYRATQGWSDDDIRAQVFTPIEAGSIRGTGIDQNSIMCYQIPGHITKDGSPIAGGTDIDESDYAFAASIYRKPTAKKAPMPSVTEFHSSVGGKGGSGK